MTRITHRGCSATPQVSIDSSLRSFSSCYEGGRWCALSKPPISDVLRLHGQRHEHSARYRFPARASFFQLCVLLQSPTSSIVEIDVWVPRHRSRHCSRCFPQLSSWRQASRASRKQTVVEWCCSAFAESAASGTAKALPHCADDGCFFLDPFSQASRAKSVVALARSLQLQHSTFSTCTIQLCAGLDSCHVLGAYTHLIQDLSKLGPFTRLQQQ